MASSDSHWSEPASPGPSNDLVVRDADNHATRPLLGDSLALLSAVFYALYVILLKVKIREESRVNMQLFFGFVGLFNILCCWPIGVILHLVGLETFELPSTQKAVAGILVNVSLNSTIIAHSTHLKSSRCALRSQATSYMSSPCLKLRR